MNINDLKELVEKIVEYTRTWSITDTEWYYNVNDTRKSETYINGNREQYITHEEFERAIREEILYCLIYNIDSIANQMEMDYESGYESAMFDNASRELEKEIQKYYADFKIQRYDENGEEID